jgi:hypothetical protein
VKRCSMTSLHPAVSPPAAVYLRLTSDVLQAIVANNGNNIKLVLGETMVSCSCNYS